MTKIIYKGTEDVRILGPEDLAKAGVEDFTETSFNRNEPAEVSEAAAEALTTKTALFGRFERVEENDVALFETSDDISRLTSVEDDQTADLNGSGYARTKSSAKQSSRPR